MRCRATASTIRGQYGRYGRYGPFFDIKVGFAFLHFQGGFKENRPTVRNPPYQLVRRGSNAPYIALRFCELEPSKLGGREAGLLLSMIASKANVLRREVLVVGIGSDGVKAQMGELRQLIARLEGI